MQPELLRGSASVDLTTNCDIRRSVYECNSGLHADQRLPRKYTKNLQMCKVELIRFGSVAPSLGIEEA